MPNRRQLLLGQLTHIIDFSIETEWLHCTGFRLFGLHWELQFSVWIKTWPRDGMEVDTRRNPTDRLRQRLAEAGITTTFYGDEFVTSLHAVLPTVSLPDLLDTMKMISTADPLTCSEPIILLD